MSGEKTEKPTQKKKDDARKKGQVAISKDVQTVFRLLSFFIVFFWLSKGYVDQLDQLMERIVTVGFGSQRALDHELLGEALNLLMMITMPLIVACAISGLVFTWVQTGFIASAEAVTPSFKKLNAVETVKSMFSKKSLIQLFLSVVKVAVLLAVAYFAVRSVLQEVVYSYRVGLDAMLFLLVDLCKDIIYLSLGIFIVIAVIDWVTVWSHHMKSLMMSRHDLKDEQKETYGNPEVKREQKREQRRILNSSLNRVGEAKVVVANPTHISIALDYEPGKRDLPFILCMGEDDDALDIRNQAKRLNIPIVVNVKLARMIYADCEVDEYIKKQHLELAAEVFKALLKTQLNQKL